MTKEQRKRLDELADKYRFCFIVHGHFHAGYNERRMDKFLSDKKPEEWEFIRITVEHTYVFWNPSPEDPHHKKRM
jgi:hypothetical protein